MDDAKSIADEAIELVYGDRGADYGHPYHDYARTADTFNALTGNFLSPKDAVLLMMCVKMSREQNKHKRDNLVDLIGYAICYERVRQHEEQGFCADCESDTAIGEVEVSLTPELIRAIQDRIWPSEQ